MKIAIIGYGRMGKAIEKQAKTLSIPISNIIDSTEALQATTFAPDEIAIEFTTADAFLNNIKILCEKQVSTVTGTTGWHQQIETIKQLIGQSNIGFLYANNFSIGVNLFLDMVRCSAKIINAFDQYDILCHEVHHKNKIDSPSGTALTLAKTLLQQLDRKNKIVTDKLERPLETDELHVSSTRGGHAIGKHSITFDSPFDSIHISHESKNREGYALGAIECAKWLYDNKKTGFYDITDFLKEKYND